MKTFKVAVKTKAPFPFVEIITAETKAEAVKLALGKYDEGAKVAWGTEPIEVHPVNYEPIKKGGADGTT